MASGFQAYKDALKRILFSIFPLSYELTRRWLPPHYALASRLSYFFWSSLPDEKLLTQVRKAGKQ